MSFVRIDNFPVEKNIFSQRTDNFLVGQNTKSERELCKYERETR
jgi:hypothetical protein